MNKERMISLKKISYCAILLVVLLKPIVTYGQLSFCTGSSGSPIFFENFGSGTTYGPALPAGTTNYTYVNSGFPQDGQYTLFFRTNLIPNSSNWHYSLDHTPDSEPNGVNGKCLIVNASNTPGQFYRRTVTGLCSNTRFEFSAWLLNIYNAASGGCTGTGIPINVTFEIWDATDTILLQSGNTGNIAGTSFPNWNQFGLVFTMPASQTSVILKMRNNGNGGCGNDLAIDDIMFRACGEYSVITDTDTGGNSTIVCENTIAPHPNLAVNTTGSIAHVYQWQESNDNINYTDIVGENGSNFTIPILNTTTYYRVKAAQDISNLNNPFCSTLSEIYTVVVNSSPNPPISNGDKTVCSNQASNLVVTVSTNESVNWYDSPTNGNLLLSNSLQYTPTAPGTFYAESFNTITNCVSNTRTAITLLPVVTISFSGSTTICSLENTGINLTASDSNATINWTASSTDVTGFSNGSGNTISQTLTYTGNATGTVIYNVTPIINGCEGIPQTITVTVNPRTNITPTFSSIPNSYCLNEVAPLLPTSSSNSTPINGTWSPSTIDTSVSGTTTYTFTPQTNACVNYAPYSINITINNTISPDFNSSIFFCSGATPPTLNTTSPNGISGTWTPATIDNLNSGSYLFTPNPNQCANTQTINVTVGTNNTTISSNGPTTICSNQTTALNLVASDPNATINWTASSTNVTGFSNGSGNTISQTLTYTGNATGTVIYSINSTLNGCVGTPQTITVTVNPQTNITPVFSGIQTLYCLNEIATPLPVLSNNSTPINGTWNPSTIDTSTLGTTTYTFIPQTIPCTTVTAYSISVTIGDNFYPDFTDNIAFCAGETAPVLTATSPNGIVGTWTPSIIDNLVSGSYTFTPTSNACAVPQTITTTVFQPTLTAIEYTLSDAFSNNQMVTITAFSNGDYLYQLDDEVPQESNVFENVNPGNHTITVYDKNGCSAPISEEILLIDYPNYFTPNNDGYNDIWQINGINNLDNWSISIFDRYGKLLKTMNSNVPFWNGIYNNEVLPASDYWFTITYTENNITKIFKSHFSLIR
ncbi:T9SS type B sorting domain-containing protein [Flavobacterium sp.]|uniref:T9SS type B sorting domain-containing protein n=1 Tax=Flavobacterium sp. TaxID=239 RepID=UPI004047ABCE